MTKRTWQQTSQLHDHRHTDYDEAKAQIHKAIGEIEEVELFGRQVLVAIYMRPQRTIKGFYQTAKFQEEDIYQGQIVLVLACGPDAFSGESDYMRATFGGPAQQPEKPKPLPADAFHDEKAQHEMAMAKYDHDMAVYWTALMDRKPKPGDWLILRPNAGELISLRGDRAEKPIGEDNFGKPIDLYEFTGWPCKIVADEMFLGRIKQPHVLV